MSYYHPPPIRTRSIAEIYSGKLHNWSPLYHPPYNPYRQYSGILRNLRRHLEYSAEQRHLKSEAERKIPEEEKLENGSQSEKKTKEKDRKRSDEEDRLELGRND